MTPGASSDLVSPELRQLLHRVDALTPVTPAEPAAGAVYPIERSVERPRQRFTVAAAAVVVVAGGVLAVAAVLPDRGSPVPPGPLSSLPEPTLPLESSTGEVAGEAACRRELAAQADAIAAEPDSILSAAEVVGVVVFEVIGDPSRVRVVLTGDTRAFVCTTERSLDATAPVDGFNTVFDPNVVPGSAGIVVHASQFETTDDSGQQGPGRVWIIGRAGTAVDEVTYVAGDGERTLASRQGEWFSLAAPIGDGVEFDLGRLEVRTVDGATRTIPTITIEMNRVLD